MICTYPDREVRRLCRLVRRRLAARLKLANAAGRPITFGTCRAALEEILLPPPRRMHFTVTLNDTPVGVVEV